MNDPSTIWAIWGALVAIWIALIGATYSLTSRLTKTDFSLSTMIEISDSEHLSFKKRIKKLYGKIDDILKRRYIIKGGLKTLHSIFQEK